MARGRRRSGGRRSGGLDWAPPVPGAPTLAERLESGDLPVGLTAEEVAEALPQLFEGLAPNTKEAYAKFARYFQQWCLPRGIRLEQVETAHIRTYMRAARPSPGAAGLGVMALEHPGRRSTFDAVRGSVGPASTGTNWPILCMTSTWRERVLPCRLTASRGS